jgi:2-keto-4-pentenoate hydratase/2-oxohepta-3-ene-1,7-dioic acid hydratase in catechol pathway
MRWATYRSRESAEGQDRVGLVVGDQVHTLAPGVRLIDLLGGGARLAEAAEKATRSPHEVKPLSGIQLRPPIPQPPAIRDFSSFQAHHRAGIEAVGQKWDDAWFEFPFFYFSNPNTMLGDGETIRIPANSRKMDYELEVCAVIGDGGIDLDPAEAERSIAGYCIFNDWSARDLQKDEMARAPVGPAKGKDTANSMGPFLVTPDELQDRRKDQSFDLSMKAFINGKLYSSGNWSTVHWSMPEQVAYASRNTRLVPGDVLCTGTVGTGCILELSLTRGGPEAFPWLKDGDEVVLEVERLGRLSNRVALGKPPHPIRGRINGSRV